MAGSLVRVNGKISSEMQGGCYVLSMPIANGRNLIVPLWEIPKDGFREATASVIGEISSKEFSYGDVKTALGVSVKQLWMLPVDEKISITGKISKLGKGYFFPIGYRGIDLTVKIDEDTTVEMFALQDMADYIEDGFKEGDEVEIYGNFVSQEAFGRDTRHPYVTMVRIDRIRHC